MCGWARRTFVGSELCDGRSRRKREEATVALARVGVRKLGTARQGAADEESAGVDSGEDADADDANDAGEDVAQDQSGDDDSTADSTSYLTSGLSALLGDGAEKSGSLQASPEDDGAGGEERSRGADSFEESCPRGFGPGAAHA